MDDADRADNITEMNAKINLYHSRRDEPQAAATGRCLYCDEPFSPDADRDITRRRWCSADCRDDWERENL